MKCKNCGHSNAAHAAKCSECNAPLEGSMIMENASSAGHQGEVTCKNCSTKNSANSLKCHECNAPLAGTNIISQVEASVSTSILSNNSSSGQCPDCGYPNILGAANCAQCRSKLKAEKEQVVVMDQRIKKTQENQQMQINAKAEGSQKIDASKTINPWVVVDKPAEDGFTLTPIDDGQMAHDKEIGFADNAVLLNRENLDPTNTTITNKSQANIQKIDGVWTIENSSELGTTFIQVNSSKNLENGDVILLGNQLYKFNDKN